MTTPRKTKEENKTLALHRQAEHEYVTVNRRTLIGTQMNLNVTMEERFDLVMNGHRSGNREDCPYTHLNAAGRERRGWWMLGCKYAEQDISLAKAMGDPRRLRYGLNQYVGATLPEDQLQPYRGNTASFYTN